LRILKKQAGEQEFIFSETPVFVDVLYKLGKNAFRNATGFQGFDAPFGGKKTTKISSVCQCLVLIVVDIKAA